jgi:hypothetical protein
MRRLSNSVAFELHSIREFATLYFRMNSVFLQNHRYIFFATVMTLMAIQSGDVWAHSGHGLHGGMGHGQAHGGNFGNGQFHHGGFGDGRFHSDHFNHHHGRGAIIIVPPLLNYYPPAYYYPQATVIQVAPVTFIERTLDGTEYNYWYYCSNPLGYYPDVQNCLSGWQAVPATSSY